MIENSPCDLLRRVSRGDLNLDGIYLDTTYCDERYTFPPQAESIEAVGEVVRREMQDTKKKPLFVFGSYTIGKEKVRN